LRFGSPSDPFCNACDQILVLRRTAKFARGCSAVLFQPVLSKSLILNPLETYSLLETPNAHSVFADSYLGSQFVSVFFPDLFGFLACVSPSRHSCCPRRSQLLSLLRMVVRSNRPCSLSGHSACHRAGLALDEESKNGHDDFARKSWSPADGNGAG